MPSVAAGRAPVAAGRAPVAAGRAPVAASLAAIFYNDLCKWIALFFTKK